VSLVEICIRPSPHIEWVEMKTHNGNDELCIVTSGLMQLVGVILCGVNVYHGLPVCVESCPASSQPLPSCLAAVLPSTAQCQANTASGYVIAAIGAGLAFTSGLVGFAMLRHPNGDDYDEPLLDGVADFVTSQPAGGHVTNWIHFRSGDV